MVSVILLSGGVGARSGKDIPKQYCDLAGKRVITYCLDALYDSGLNDELIIVYGEGFLDLIKSILEDYKDKFKTVKFTTGGETRQLSVYNGLKLCSFDKVILHESARPLITSEDLINIKNYKSESVTMGIDIPFTVLKKENGEISEVLKRDDLFNVQLPQKFPTFKLLEAHKKAILENRSFTDDSSLIFYYGERVSVLEGSHNNIKITNPGDFQIAEEILRNR